MSVLTRISPSLLIIYALSTGVMSASPSLDHNSISPRDTYKLIRAGVNITLFSDTSCGHDNVFQTDNLSLTYGVMEPIFFTIQSYILSRYLSSEEQLDFSAPYPPDTKPPGGHIPEECGKYLQFTNPDSNGNTLRDGTCYLIVGGATASDLFQRTGFRE